MSRRGAKQGVPAIELPRRSEAVNLVLATGVRIPARVVESRQNELLVAVTVRTKPFSEVQLDTMTLEFVDTRGRVRLRGKVSVPDPSDPDLLRIGDLRSVELLQEREYVRVKAARPVLMSVGYDQRSISSYTVDVSGGGMLLAGPDTLKIGEQIRFALTIEQGEPPIEGTAKVVRSDPQGRRSVAFSSISDLNRRRLIRFIFECQRLERRRGLELRDRYGN